MIFGMQQAHKTLYSQPHRPRHRRPRRLRRSCACHHQTGKFVSFAVLPGCQSSPALTIPYR